MEVYFAPELQAKIDQIVAEGGRAPEELLEDAMAVYVERKMTPRRRFSFHPLAADLLHYQVRRFNPPIKSRWASRLMTGIECCRLTAAIHM